MMATTRRWKNYQSQIRRRDGENFSPKRMQTATFTHPVPIDNSDDESLLSPKRTQPATSRQQNPLDDSNDSLLLDQDTAAAKAAEEAVAETSEENAAE